MRHPQKAWRVASHGAHALLPLMLSACALPEAWQSRRSSSEAPAAPALPRDPAHGADSAATAADGSGRTGTAGAGVFDAPGPELWARWNALRGDAYELDALDRFVETGPRRVRCAPETLVIYRGAALRYHAPLTVSPPFQARLERFEQVVSDVAREIYGRPPRRVQHYGAYSCRTSRNRSYRMSEHALGNAVDIVGFDFGPATKTDPLSPELPRRLAQPFQVRVAKHWKPGEGAVAETHARFLRTLTERLIDRRDVFRGFVGPGHPGHDDHLHFDMAPWRYVRL